MEEALIDMVIDFEKEIFDPRKNEWLILRPNVIRGLEEVDEVIVRLDKYFGHFKHKAYVTSILRLPVDQLKIIISYAKRYKIPVNFSARDVYKKLDNGNYVWQETWSLLLNRGVIINPPLAAKVLFDYIRHGRNKKGEIIKPSPHFFGKSFDIGGGITGIDDELKILKAALQQDPKIKIRRYLVERANNALHIDV